MNLSRLFETMTKEYERRAWERREVRLHQSPMAWLMIIEADHWQYSVDGAYYFSSAMIIRIISIIKFHQSYPETLISFPIHNLTNWGTIEGAWIQPQPGVPFV